MIYLYIWIPGAPSTVLDKDDDRMDDEIITHEDVVEDMDDDTCKCFLLKRNCKFYSGASVRQPIG